VIAVGDSHTKSKNFVKEILESIDWMLAIDFDSSN
jgi:hypothetical protein